jgi:rRNA processing protein Gar1
MGAFMHAVEDEMLCSSLMPDKVPYFNAPIYLQNKSVIGKVDEILGPINEVYFSIKMGEGMVASSFKKGDKVYIAGDKLLPLERFLPKPKIPGTSNHHAVGVNRRSSTIRPTGATSTLCVKDRTHNGLTWWFPQNAVAAVQAVPGAVVGRAVAVASKVEAAAFHEAALVATGVALAVIAADEAAAAVGLVAAGSAAGVEAQEAAVGGEEVVEEATDVRFYPRIVSIAVCCALRISAPSSTSPTVVLTLYKFVLLLLTSELHSWVCTHGLSIINRGNGETGTI